MRAWSETCLMHRPSRLKKSSSHAGAKKTAANSQEPQKRKPFSSWLQSRRKYPGLMWSMTSRARKRLLQPSGKKGHLGEGHREERHWEKHRENQQGLSSRTMISRAHQNQKHWNTSIIP